MSIIEEAMRRAAEQRASGAVPPAAVRVEPALLRGEGGAPRPDAPARTEPIARARGSRREHVVLPGAAAARRFRSASFDVSAWERNHVLPRVADRSVLRAYKILRTRILHRLAAQKWHSLAVTGTAPGEGKSLTAINLAMALAQDVNTWVFLVDVDLQRPQVGGYLGMSFAKGLGDYLVGDAQIDDIVYEAGTDRLAVIPNGRSLEHSSELLASPRMAELMRALESETPRRVMVFDMPPLLLSDDVLAFEPQIDALLLVVAEGRTSRGTLLAAREVLSEMNLAGVVLNRSSERNDSQYY